MLKLNDQFDTFVSPEVLGFNFTDLRKNPNKLGFDQYQYKIGADAALYDGTRGYVDPVGDKTFLLKPKKPGEWIDITLTDQDLYLYLECGLTYNDEYHSMNSAELKTSTFLPKKFSGDFIIGYNNIYQRNTYKTVLSRRLLAILSNSQQPIQICKCPDIYTHPNDRDGIYRIVL
jgi:hypothetical protein